MANKVAKPTTNDTTAVNTTPFGAFTCGSVVSSARVAAPSYPANAYKEVSKPITDT